MFFRGRLKCMKGKLGIYPVVMAYCCNYGAVQCEGMLVIGWSLPAVVVDFDRVLPFVSRFELGRFFFVDANVACFNVNFTSVARCRYRQLSHEEFTHKLPSLPVDLRAGFLSNRSITTLYIDYYFHRFSTFAQRGKRMYSRPSHKTDLHKTQRLFYPPPPNNPFYTKLYTWSSMVSVREVHLPQKQLIMAKNRGTSRKAKILKREIL